MKSFVQIGFGNFVSAEKITGLYSIDTKPIKDKIAKGKELGIVTDLTRDKKTKTLIILNDGTLVLSAISAATLMKRINDDNKNIDDDDFEY